MTQEAITNLLDELSEVSDFDEDEVLHCRCCQRAITAENFRIRRQGAHQHRFSNPRGQVYDVCCFQWAPGALISGIATGEYCWFLGYRWQYAHCEECQTHLGWYYENSQEAFFGLIPDSLDEPE